jgi:hypothetical protein
MGCILQQVAQVLQVDVAVGGQQRARNLALEVGEQRARNHIRLGVAHSFGHACGDNVRHQLLLDLLADVDFFSIAVQPELLGRAAIVANIRRIVARVAKFHIDKLVVVVLIKYKVETIKRHCLKFFVRFFPRNHTHTTFFSNFTIDLIVDSCLILDSN